MRNSRSGRAALFSPDLSARYTAISLNVSPTAVNELQCMQLNRICAGMLLACTNEKGDVNVCLFESNDYGMTRVGRRITHHSHHTWRRVCRTRRCRSRRRRCTLQRVVNFLSRRPFFNFIAFYLHHSCTDTDEEHIVVVSMSRSICTCNSVLDAAPLLVWLQCRLCNFPVFSLIFRPTPLLATPSILHRSR
jgi:hypothetical protein